MPSILPDFEYDIFISYRQKDNKYDGWVNEFVTNLKRELEATCKKDVSIFFDENPTDGLQDNHVVNKSLEGKLKCLVFIPIISRTYCDPRSFAWQFEFLSFIEIAKNDRFGKEVKLTNGNVASRILPVKIHDLDNYDKDLLERVLGSFMRPVEFIYKSPGVNRPLKPDDTRIDNQSHTYYRDQINKVANAIRDILYALEYPVPGSKVSDIRTQKESEYDFKQSRSRKRIAVLPFTDLSPDRSQEYLGDGMAVELITMLSQIEELKVTGRSSSFMFKNNHVDLKSIGDALNVETILEGSIQKISNRIRITAQFINAIDGYQIWSQRYDRNIDDIFALQDDICSKIVENLKLIFTDYVPGRSTKDPLAYEMFLKGDYFDKLYTTEGFHKAIEYFKKALELDPDYSDAWWYLGLVNFELHGFLHLEKVRLETVMYCANKSLSIDPNNSNAHFLLALVHFNLDYDWEKMNNELIQGIENTRTPFPLVFAPLEPWIKAMIYGDFEFAVKKLQQAVDHDPLSMYYQFHLSQIYLYGVRDYEKTIVMLQNIMEFGFPEYPALRPLCLSYLFKNDYETAEKYAIKDYNYSNGKGHGAANLIICYASSGKLNEAQKLY